MDKTLEKPKQKKPMSIVVGIICEDQIVMASESQTTYGTRKSLDAIKIHEVAFKNGPILVGCTGDIAPSEMTVLLMRKEAAEISITDDTSVLGVVGKAMQGVREILIQQLLCGAQKTDRQLEDLWRGSSYDLMVGFHANDKPHLYTVSLTQGVPQKARKLTTIGCGAEIADFLLRRFKFDEISLTEASLVTLYAIEKVKQFDAYCNGAVQLATLFRPTAEVPGLIEFVEPAIIDEVVPQLLKLEKAAETKWKQSMGKLIQKLSPSLGTNVFTTPM